MVNKTLLKETKNFIKKNKKTYIAQIIIIMLGVGFFVGMKISSLDLEDTMTKFVEKNNFYDLKVNLEYGISNEDIDGIKNVLKEVKYIEGAYTQDTVSNYDGKDYVIRIHSYNPEKKINTIKLKKGKLPATQNECVVDTKMAKDGFEIGKEITINSDLIHEKTVKIVGIIQSPEYLAIDRGNSTLLSGKINYYVYLHESNVNSDVYSDLYIKFDTSEKAFTENYDDFIERKEIESTYTVSGYFKDKYNELITEYQLQLNSAKSEYQAEKAKIDVQFIEAENEIKEKETTLNDAKKGLLSAKDIEKKIQESGNATKQEEKAKLDSLKVKLDAAEAEYNNQKANLNSQNATIQNKINSNEAKIKTLEAQIAANEKTLAEKTAKYNNMSDYIETTTTTEGTKSCSNYPGSKQSEDGNKCCYYNPWMPHYPTMCYDATIVGGGTTTNKTPNAEKTALKKEIDNLSSKISQQKIEKSSLETENTNLKKQLKTTATLAAAEANYNNLKKQYEEQLQVYNSLGDTNKLSQYYQQQNKELQKTIKQYENEIAAAKTELAGQKEIAYAELEKVALEIQNGEDMLSTLTYPDSYVFNRKDNAGYGQFIADIEKISNLAIVVPVVFYFITFFMISASISRMLHEERNQIGTLKAIGIRDKEIITKYLIYSISSVVIGSLLGIIIGIIILPLFVYFIYEMLYEFPTRNLNFNLEYFLIASGIAFAVAVVSTLICCKDTFKERPVALLKAKQEKESTSSFFEKITFLWDKLSLTSKISLKNIFRYKVRMLMTVVGIGGCLALMLTGLSLRTSITEMIPAQYGKIFKVQAQIFFKDLSTREEINQGVDQILALEHVESGIMSNFETYTSENDGKTLNINTATFFDDNFTDYIELIDYKTNKTLKLPEDGVIVSEKLAKIKDLQPGSVIKIKDKQQQEYPLIVRGIAKNYIEHYIYMNSSYYEQVFNKTARNNMLLLKTDEKHDELTLATQMTNTGVVSQVLYVSLAEKAYNDIMNNLALLVGVFVVFSVLLVFAVLYNLININIRERSKEIATYKVLGFSNRKVISIVKRENIVLMFFGVIFGLISGYILSIIVIQTCETENLNFLKEVTLGNCLISTISTIIFTLIFSMIINKYVKKINLTESLKSNE